ncbi:unnamed protein product [Heligmosomoides polygyrus]|uniref:Uncharacterized protein n=1 Tax=Heligmosomoides polygyrus TaxID=6339 RepID=A0A183GQW9_HELPZ|nr:unnamed protein product [Heligmosomoides polygyrus]
MKRLIGGVNRRRRQRRRRDDEENNLDDDELLTHTMPFPRRWLDVFPVDQPRIASFALGERGRYAPQTMRACERRGDGNFDVLAAQLTS